MEAPELTIELTVGYLAATRTRCVHCRTRLTVRCLYVRRGRVDGEPLEGFTLQRVQAVDARLAAQLAPWSSYRFVPQQGCWLNHCDRCAAAQPDEDLHDEPGQPFFDLQASARRVRFVALPRALRAAADYHLAL